MSRDPFIELLERRHAALEAHYARWDRLYEEAIAELLRLHQPKPEPLFPRAPAPRLPSEREGR